jgi:hypothetical protein
LAFPSLLMREPLRPSQMELSLEAQSFVPRQKG